MNATRQRSLCSALVVALLLLLISAGGALARDMESCTRCHDETWESPVLNILQTPHAAMADERTPFAANACEGCHGDSGQHMKAPADDEARTPPPVTFGEEHTSVAKQNETCLGCHDSGERMHWRGSMHNFEELACVSCHTVHVPRDPILDERKQTEVCTSCHARQKSEALRPSAHPVQDGAMSCSNCHNPHGTLNESLLRRSNVNETCYDCHAEKRGPVLWEHAPVTEDCTTCHQPHGSIHQPMLKARGPQLCQQCHLGTHSSAAFGGDSLDTPFMAGKNCLNCHVQVHGSNHPQGQTLRR
ncbi:DmsE family decaheme c-type cytochrome [Thiohalomonas denitrificans]|uniref:Decaheme c-type cytochrome, DmsE family n=1 Tax=Thiohalomonas denitrificans TaxID=415747 RepID=A0A1G5QV02_9GAMM|nr:DmsE family decaheme c-type cytochrome [Thiohalomonas denitrificans]SCZ65675.1 decaheme c-type cytochrome, DmsE family [Thiohalomonas denitrificans]